MHSHRKIKIKLQILSNSLSNFVVSHKTKARHNRSIREIHKIAEADGQLISPTRQRELSKQNQNSEQQNNKKKQNKNRSRH